MSWDTMYHDRVSKCACGKGKVIQHIEQREDDWNRSETHCIGEEIICPECKENYHIEHVVRHYNCYSWVGNGISDRTFLVPNEIVMPKVKEKSQFSFSKIDEEIVSKIYLSDIKSAIIDMKTNKYTTKLQLSHSNSIVRMYYKCYKKKSLNLIIPLLETIVQNYDSYKWTPKAKKNSTTLNRKL